MEYSDYVKRISFRFYKPHRYPKGFNFWNRVFQRLNLSLEVLNTRLPYNSKVTLNRLSDLLVIPRWSTFAIGALINEGVSQMSDNCCFVNVGVWHGFTFLSGLIGNPQKKCIGVDNFSEPSLSREEVFQRFNKYKSPNHYFYGMDYIDYFSKIHTDQIGFYVYDGEHSYENQWQGLQIAEPFFSKDCIILIDDVNWHEPRQASLDFIDNSSFQYEILLNQSTYENGHPTFWNGIMILRKSN